MGYLCANFGCSHFPRHTCVVRDHQNPVMLPIFNQSIPSCYQEMTRECRAWLPRNRPLARQLLESITRHTQHNESSCRVFDDSWTVYVNSEDYIRVWCDECGSLCSHNHFNCIWCDEGNFDLCHDCVTRGVHCKGLTHTLRRRSIKNGKIVEED